MVLSIITKKRRRRRGGNGGTNVSWAQFGSDLIGEGSEDYFGHSISLNAAGDVIAVGAFNNGAGKGSARIFSRSGNSWVQRGLDIDGTNTIDEFGRRISLNAVGDRVAITASGGSGYTRVYSWDGSSWIKLGQDLSAGGVVNDTGNLVIVHNEAYSWNGSSWTQVGSDIFNGFVRSVASDFTGARVVLGIQGSFGSVRVFDWNGSSWIQVGETFESQQVDDFLGTSHTIDINSAGNRIILGAPRFNSPPSIDNGRVRIYDWNGTSWVQVGQDITGVANEYFGECVGIDAAGNRIIIGSTGTNPSRSGKAVVYDWNGSSWVQVFQVTGSVQSNTGRDVDISSNGRTIAIGDSNSQRGRVKIYDLESMAFIPQGAFNMGDSLDGIANAIPVRAVTLDDFYIGRYEITKAEWDEVRAWGLNNGYTDLGAGLGKASNHPVQSISWYDTVKWCNARSEKEGFMPAYYTNDVQTTIYKTGNVNVTNAQVNWSVNGYRLPTEAEWEKAARGGLSGKRFPWGDTISHSQANYYASSSYNYDLSGSVNNFHPTYAKGSSSVGSFAPNGYGLYDMTGNIYEWCWDGYGTYAPGNQLNPRGAISPGDRILRGSSFNSDAQKCRVSHRSWLGPTSWNGGVGFRVVRSSV